MAADWDEISRISVPSDSTLHPLPDYSPAVAFDDSQELLWIGNYDGVVASYYGSDLRRYTSVKAHIGEGPVRHLLSHDKGILSVSAKGVHFVGRNGITLWHLQDPSMVDLRCSCATSNPNHVLVGGCQAVFFLIDVDKGQIVQQYPAQSRYIIMRKARHICAATDDGKIHALSLTDYSLLNIWEAHANTVNDMDARNDFLVTCGSSSRGLGPRVFDPLAKVYDLKNLRSLSPIPFHAGAAHIRLHPKLQTTSFVTSQTGQVQVLDIMNPTSVTLKQANVSYLHGLEVSSSGDAIVVKDSLGTVSLWGSPSKVKFNVMSKETLFADPRPNQMPRVDWNDAPLNSVGMPYYTERLLTTSIAAPKFLSEKAKDVSLDASPPHVSSTANALAGVTLNGRAQTEEERMLKYNKVEIKYSRFGVEDFDFQYFNKTQYSGLETHIANSFINSLLQLYKFVPLIRNCAIQHAATSCVTGNCLLCEFGFLFDMLEKAEGQNCQATNLLRAFGASREAANLNLFEASAALNSVSLSSTIQSVNRFFLNQMAHDYMNMASSTDGVDGILATKAVEVIRCIYCNNETTKNASTYVHDLQYPQIDPKHYRPNMVRFSAVLKSSIERETRNRAWCTRCRKYQPLAMCKSIHQLPLVLMLNASLVNPSARAFWEQSGWLPSEIGLIAQDRGLYCFEGSDLALHVRNNSRNLVVYELVGFVAEIDIDDREQPHLISMANVEISSRTPRVHAQHKPFPNWHLFNDFLVSPVEPREALHFKKTWKMPSVVCYQVKSAHGKIDDSWKDTLNTALLYQQYSINGYPATDSVQLLDPDSELPSPGIHIALDTEFVELEKAEIDVKADGRQETVRPAKSGLARVSVLRGEGKMEGTPFIDDYITIHEPIVDYKTQYSGIHAGDLDPQVSHHNLVPLKVAYKKLWLLLNLGCIFVGHGLASDFRKANIHVPKAQTVDTQHLYLAPGKNRRLSLRYLAWAVFKEWIQEDPLPSTLIEGDPSQIDGHDSIEDARMALRLFRKYQEWEAKGTVEQMLEDVYKRGARYNWKPPPRSVGVAGSLLSGSAGGEGGGSNFGSGRNTPDMAGGSGPGTPLSKAQGVPLFRFSADMIDEAEIPALAALAVCALRTDPFHDFFDKYSGKSFYDDTVNKLTAGLKDPNGRVFKAVKLMMQHDEALGEGHGSAEERERGKETGASVIVGVSQWYVGYCEVPKVDPFAASKGDGDEGNDDTGHISEAVICRDGSQPAD
ncbi:hypothetical protein DV737_g2197, partial [Chaetothyriales sp. CBS 132003]